MKITLVFLLAALVVSEAMPFPSSPSPIAGPSGAPLTRSDKDACLAKCNKIILPVKKRQCKQRCYVEFPPPMMTTIRPTTVKS